MSIANLKGVTSLRLPLASIATNKIVWFPSAVLSNGNDVLNTNWPNALKETGTGAPPSTDAVNETTPDRLSITRPTMEAFVVIV